MKPLLTYFVLAYLISWTIWAPLYLPKLGIKGLPVLPYQHFLGAFGPAISAFLVTYALKGKQGIIDLLQRVVKWNVHWRWYAIVFVSTIGVFFVAATFVYSICNETATLRGLGTSNEFPNLSVVGFFVLNLFTFGFGEEIGWRGFVLPSLQTRYNAFVATLLLTIGWACWHLPAFLYRPSYSNMNVAGFVGFFISLLAGSILLTWLYNSTKGSIFLVALFHTLIEIIFTSNNISPLISAFEGTIIAVLACVVLITFKPKSLSRKMRQMAL
jgi:membrane protease YdiL (CAAX protease family)